MESRVPRWIGWVPNELSCLRLALAIAFPFFPGVARLPTVIAAAASDWLDGLIARRFGVQSTFGGLLDAVADKAFVLSTLCTLAADGVIAWWQVPLVLVRDLAVVSVALVFGLRRQWDAFRAMSARRWGKLTTLLVFALFVALLVESLDSFRIPLFVLAAASSLVAAVDYLVQFARALGGRTTGDGQGPHSMEE